MPDWLTGTGQYVRTDSSDRPTRDPYAYLRHLIGIHPVGPADLCVQRLTDTIAVTGVRH